MLTSTWFFLKNAIDMALFITFHNCVIFGFWFTKVNIYKSQIIKYLNIKYDCRWTFQFRWENSTMLKIWSILVFQFGWFCFRNVFSYETTLILLHSFYFINFYIIQMSVMKSWIYIIAILYFPLHRSRQFERFYVVLYVFLWILFNSRNEYVNR